MRLTSFLLALIAGSSACTLSLWKQKNGLPDIG
jgi:hypothetical protein